MGEELRQAYGHLEDAAVAWMEECKALRARVAALERRNAHFVDVCLAIQNGDDAGPCFDLTPAELAAAEARRKQDA